LPRCIWDDDTCRIGTQAGDDMLLADTPAAAKALYARLKSGQTTEADRASLEDHAIRPPRSSSPAADVQSIESSSQSSSRNRGSRRGLCARHPKACREQPPPTSVELQSSAPATAAVEVDAGSPGGDAGAPAATPAAAALKALSHGWCRSSEGCIASNWNPSDLPRPLAASLLHAGRSVPPSARPPPGIACFDMSRLRRPATAACRAGANTSSHGAQSPVFDGEFGFELLHALPYLHWRAACGQLPGPTTACPGMAPFYFFARHGHTQRRCGTRPPRSHWLAGTHPRGSADGWSWAGRHSLQFYAYPSPRWLPPPLHHHYRPLLLPPWHPPASAAGGAASAGSAASAGGGWRRRVWVQNKYYPEGHGTADNFWALDEVKMILDALLGCVHQARAFPPSRLGGVACAARMGPAGARRLTALVHVLPAAPGRVAQRARSLCRRMQTTKPRPSLTPSFVHSSPSLGTSLDDVARRWCTTILRARCSVLRTPTTRAGHARASRLATARCCAHDTRKRCAPARCCCCPCSPRKNVRVPPPARRTSLLLHLHSSGARRGAASQGRRSLTISSSCASLPRRAASLPHREARRT
jgi:hypothetical protein